MKTQSVFHLISKLTEKEGIACILIGGFAVNYYKVARQTADVDFLITRENFERIFPELQRAGYKKGLGQENFVQLKSAQAALMDVDFMFVDQETLEKILKESRKIKIAKQDFFVPSLDHLIALKLHSIKHNPKIRLTRDLPDVINLIRINEVDIKNSAFRELCLKYGTEEIYQRIQEAFK
jgi:hypothetical protein